MRKLPRTTSGGLLLGSLLLLTSACGLAATEQSTDAALDPVEAAGQPADGNVGSDPAAASGGDTGGGTGGANAQPAAASTYSGPVPTWFSIPPGYTVIGSDLSGADVQTLIIDGNTDVYGDVCRDFAAQAGSAALPVLSGSCNESTLVHQTGNQTATIQSFGSGSAQFVFIGFELTENGIERADAGTGANTDADTGTATGSDDQAMDDDPGDDATTATTTNSGGTTDGDAEPPVWFVPGVAGTSVAEQVDEDGVYSLIVAANYPDTPGTYTGLCQEFEQQASAAGWARVEGDECGEEIFDGATFTEPLTGLEGRIRSYRSGIVVYTFEIASGLAPTQITEIAFDPNAGLVPAGFTLAPGDQVAAVGQELEAVTNSVISYTTQLQVIGGNDFAARCRQLEADTGRSPDFGSCDDPIETVAFAYDDGQIILSENVYTFRVDSN